MFRQGNGHGGGHHIPILLQYPTDGRTMPQFMRYIRQEIFIRRNGELRIFTAFQQVPEGFQVVTVKPVGKDGVGNGCVRVMTAPVSME